MDIERSYFQLFTYLDSGDRVMSSAWKALVFAGNSGVVERMYGFGQVTHENNEVLEINLLQKHTLDHLSTDEANYRNRYRQELDQLRELVKPFLDVTINCWPSQPEETKEKSLKINFESAHYKTSKLIFDQRYP